jgi:hypothetical protein
MNLRQRSALADTTLAAGATVLLLYSTASAHGGWPALAAGIVLVLAGIAMLWGTPRPDLHSRMLASVAGLFLGYGAALLGTLGAWVSLGAGALLLLGLWGALGRAR